MTKERKNEAVDYIMSCLKDGYLDLGLYDQDELRIVEEAMHLYLFDNELIKNCKAYIPSGSVVTKEQMDALCEIAKTPINISEEVWDKINSMEHIKMKF